LEIGNNNLTAPTKAAVMDDNLDEQTKRVLSKVQEFSSGKLFLLQRS